MRTYYAKTLADEVRNHYFVEVQYATNESNFINQYVTNGRGNAKDAS